jgi:hypothetical protein
MWPFDFLRKHNYERRYRAALIVYLGAHMGDLLSDAQRASVEADMDSNFKGSTFPAAAWHRSNRWYAMAAFRAAAMERVGIQPPIMGLSWAQLFQPWSRGKNVTLLPGLPEFDRRAIDLVRDFRVIDTATEDAITFLRASGMSIP